MNNANELVTAHMELNPGGQPVNYHPGLTKLEHFTGLAMQALINEDSSQESIGIQAVNYAKNALDALDKLQNGESK